MTQLTHQTREVPAAQLRPQPLKHIISFGREEDFRPIWPTTDHPHMLSFSPTLAQETLDLQNFLAHSQYKLGNPKYANYTAGKNARASHLLNKIGFICTFMPVGTLPVKEILATSRC